MYMASIVDDGSFDITASKGIDCENEACLC